jgi:hypothetical protein
MFENMTENNFPILCLLMNTNKSTSQRQGRLREEGSKGSRGASDDFRLKTNGLCPDTDVK